MCILYFRRSSQAKKPSSPPNFRSGTPCRIRSRCRCGKLAERHVHRKVVVAGQRQQLLQLVGVGRRVPRRDGPLAERLVRVGNDQVHVDADHVAKTLALGTRPQRTVETVQPRLGQRILDAAILAGQLRAEAHPPPRPAVDLDEGRGERGEGRGKAWISDFDFGFRDPEPLAPEPSSTNAQHRPRPLVNAVSSESRSRLSAGTAGREPIDDRRRSGDEVARGDGAEDEDCAVMPRSSSAPVRIQIHQPPVDDRPHKAVFAQSGGQLLQSCRPSGNSQRKGDHVPRARGQLRPELSAALCGLSQRTSRPHFRQNTWPILANNSRR